MSQYGANKAKNTDEARAERTKLESAFSGLCCAVATIGVVAIGASSPANAVPSFARQTGQPCGACHTDFPGLTPFGRQFKLGGYTLGGGPYQTTPFESSGDAATKALDSYAKKIKGKTDEKSADAGYHGWVPPLAMAWTFTLTHTRADQTGNLSPWGANDNVQLSELAFFYAGAITNNIGAFAQVNYEGPPPGGGMAGDPFGTKQWHWDMMDFRYANTGSLNGWNVTYGITANNNPTLEDPWNTTPVWSFPYFESSVQPDPEVGPLVGSWEMTVAGGGPYVQINDLVYLHVAGYHSLDRHFLDFVGMDPFMAPVIEGVAPYWRIAVTPHWGNNFVEVGTFGMYSRVHQWMDPAGFNTPTYSDTDRYTDYGFDGQYQYQGDNYWVTFRGTYVHEDQRLDSTFANGGSDNRSNTLDSIKLYGSVAYGDDNRVVISGQYFNIWGSSDATLYADTASAMSPDVSGFTVDIAYIPFMVSQPKIWPWANVRLGMQYTWYDKFGGTTMGASDNDTLLGYLLIAY